MERLRRAFLRFDERFGGTKPPPRVQVYLARHPVGTGVVHGVFQGLLFAAALSAFDDPGRMLQAVLVGLGAGLFAWLVCRFERRRQAHYERKGGSGRLLSLPSRAMHCPCGLRACYGSATGRSSRWSYGLLDS